MCKQAKIQQLLLSHLSDEGHIQLRLPDGMILELGVVAEGKYGQLEKQDNYCWAIVSQKNREVSIDSFNLGLRFCGDNKIILEDSAFNKDGVEYKTLDVI